MKRYILIFLMLIVFAVCGTLLLISCSAPKAQNDYIRIHIRANSDSSDDQSVKLAVRDAVVQDLTPYASQAVSKEENWSQLSRKEEEIRTVADATLVSCGYDYRSQVSLRQEAFPERTYGDLTLQAGIYDAVIVELGAAEGQNWWCVAFPPLCFIAAEETGKEEIEYRSWIAELFRK